MTSFRWLDEKKGDSPLFYILIILALKKVKDGKKGTVPFFSELTAAGW
jgi:hypothetical protein